MDEPVDFELVSSSPASEIVSSGTSDVRHRRFGHVFVVSHSKLAYIEVSLNFYYYCSATLPAVHSSNLTV